MGRFQLAKTFYVVSNSGTSISGNRFFPISTNLIATTTEAFAETSFIKSGGVLSGAKVYISANTNAVTTIFDLVINSTVGNQSIAVTTLATGLFEDADSDTISASDEVNWEVTASAWVGLTLQFTTCSFAPTTFHHIFSSKIRNTFCKTTGGIFSEPNAPNSNATELNAKLNMRVAGTLEKCRVYVSANADTGGATVKSRVNGANGNISVVITASTTGEFLDVSNTDSISVDNDLNFTGSTTVTGDVTVESIQVAFTPTVDGSFILNNGNPNGNNPGANTTIYIPPGTTGAGGVATESDALVTLSSAYTVSELQAYILTNTGGSAGTIDLRLDTGGGPASTALTMSITAATTGWFSDVTNSVSVASGNTVDYRVVGPTSGDFTFTTISAVFLAPADPVSSRLSTLTLLGVG